MAAGRQVDDGEPGMGDDRRGMPCRAGHDLDPEVIGAAVAEGSEHALSSRACDVRRKA